MRRGCDASLWFLLAQLSEAAAQGPRVARQTTVLDTVLSRWPGDDSSMVGLGQTRRSLFQVSAISQVVFKEAGRKCPWGLRPDVASSPAD